MAAVAFSMMLVGVIFYYFSDPILRSTYTYGPLKRLNREEQSAEV